MVWCGWLTLSSQCLCNRPMTRPGVTRVAGMKTMHEPNNKGFLSYGQSGYSHFWVASVPATETEAAPSTHHHPSRSHPTAYLVASQWHQSFSTLEERVIITPYQYWYKFWMWGCLSFIITTTKAFTEHFISQCVFHTMFTPTRDLFYSKGGAEMGLSPGDSLIIPDTPQSKSSQTNRMISSLLKA